MIKINKELKLNTPLEHKDADRLNICVKAIINKNTFGTILISSEGLGKTRGIRELLENTKLKENKDWIHISANITDSELYKTLYDHKDKIIFFDDIGKAAKTDAGITILKQATETKDGNNRIVSWNSPTFILKDYPDKFEFNGYLIMCLNSKPDTKDADIRALMSRLLSCTFFPSNKTILEMMFSLRHKKAKENKIKVSETIKIFKHIQQHSGTDNHQINLRLFDKAIMWYKTDKDNWEKYVLEDMNLDEETLTVFNIIKTQKLNGKLAVKKWTETTGKKKTRFYEVYKTLKQQFILE